jgi:transposase
MSYSVDLRKRVLEYISAGGSKSSASKIFKIHRNTITKWFKLSAGGSLSDPKPQRSWKKIDPEDLIEAVSKNSNWLLSDFARVFKVTTAAICLAFKNLKITRKKRVIYTENETKKSVKYFWQRSLSMQRKS